MLVRLSEFDAFADPLRKKALPRLQDLGAARLARGLRPGAWEVCADNVLMRLALRSGLVERATSRRSARRPATPSRQVAEQAKISPPVLDDLLWERGREDPDLLGNEAGERRAARREGVVFY